MLIYHIFLCSFYNGSGYSEEEIYEWHAAFKSAFPNGRITYDLYQELVLKAVFQRRRPENTDDMGAQVGNYGIRFDGLNFRVPFEQCSLLEHHCYSLSFIASGDLWFYEEFREKLESFHKMKFKSILSLFCSTTGDAPFRLII